MSPDEAYAELLESGGNAHAVGAMGRTGAVVIMNRAPLMGPMSKRQAVNLAAWLCVIADIQPDELTRALVKALGD